MYMPCMYLCVKHTCRVGHREGLHNLLRKSGMSIQAPKSEFHEGAWSLWETAKSY